jgi:hypothetical protein
MDFYPTFLISWPVRVKIGVRDLHLIPLGSRKFRGGRYSENCTLSFKGWSNVVSNFFFHFRPICMKFGADDVHKIYWVTVSSMKIGGVKAILRGVMNLCILRIYCPVWVKFGIRELRRTLLNTGEFHENRRREGVLFVGVFGIIYTCPTKLQGF